MGVWNTFEGDGSGISNTYFKLASLKAVVFCDGDRFSSQALDVKRDCLVEFFAVGVLTEPSQGLHSNYCILWRGRQHKYCHH